MPSTFSFLFSLLNSLIFNSSSAAFVASLHSYSLGIFTKGLIYKCVVYI